jgi:hypothetical protein
LVFRLGNLLEKSAMRKKLTISLCAALVGLLASFEPALAEQKSAKQCNDEWKADQAAIKASGQTWKSFIAQCRGIPEEEVKRKAATPTSGTGQYAAEADARASCPADTVVWINLGSGIYHASGSRSFGKTKKGAYMCEKETIAAGFRAPKVAHRN